MNKRKNLKGMTLIELIVVMAIFSIIMLGAMQFFDPISRMMKRASVEDANSASIDNFKRYLENSLRYAECLEVCEGDLTDNNGNVIVGTTTESKETIFIKNFVKNHFTNMTVQGSEDPFKTRVRMLKIDNSKGGLVTEYEWDVTAGYTYKIFDNKNPVMIDALDADGNPVVDSEGHKVQVQKTGYVDPVVTQVGSESEVFNPSMYDAYNFRFIPGYNEKSVFGNESIIRAAFGIADGTSIKDDAETYYATVDPVKFTTGGGVETTYVDFSQGFFSMTVVTYKKDNQPAEYVDSSDPSNNFMLYKSPMAVSNINMSLVNINTAFAAHRTAKWAPVRWKGAASDGTYDPTSKVDKDDDGKWDYEVISVGTTPKIDSPFFQHKNVDGDCIYFIYTMTDQK